jgi:hypothetical protein
MLKYHLMLILFISFLVVDLNDRYKKMIGSFFSSSLLLLLLQKTETSSCVSLRYIIDSTIVPTLLHIYINTLSPLRIL